LAINWFKYSAPTTFYGLGRKLIPWCAVSAAILCAVSLYIGFYVAPVDATKAVLSHHFIHVPASILSMFLYPGHGGLRGTRSDIQDPLVVQ